MAISGEECQTPLSEASLDFVDEHGRVSVFNRFVDAVTRFGDRVRAGAAFE
jgi:hypothetical protein